MNDSEKEINLISILLIIVLILAGCCSSNNLSNDPVGDINLKILEWSKIMTGFYIEEVTVHLKNLGGKGKFKLQFYFLPHDPGNTGFMFATNVP